MKILLTGVSGFLGGRTILALIKKYGVNSVVALTSKKNANINCIKYSDFHNFNLDKNIFNDITHIIHAGAFIPKMVSESNDLNACFNNIAYTKELLSYSLENLVKFINISTLDVYSPDIDIITETSELRPVSLYASSKLYCEEMVKTFAIHECIDYVNFRVGHVYGPGEEKYKKVLPISIKKILKGQPLELFGDGSDLRNYIFIDDVVDAVINSLEMDIRSIDINLASSKSVSIKELLENIIEISNENVQIIQRESNHKKRNIRLDNSLLMRTVLKKETELYEGLKIEYEYMKGINENNI